MRIYRTVMLALLIAIGLFSYGEYVRAVWNTPDNSLLKFFSFVVFGGFLAAIESTVRVLIKEYKK